MKRLLCIALAMMFIFAFHVPAYASTSLKNCALFVDGERVSLSASTGYIKKSGSAMMVPAQAALKAAGISYQVNSKTGVLSCESPTGQVVEIKKGAKSMRVDGKIRSLRVKTEKHKDNLIADIRFLGALSLTYKSYKDSSDMRARGYKQGALVVAKSGGPLTLPENGTTAVSDGNESILPEKARTAAKSASQIVTVKYLGKSKATLTYFAKGTNGQWKKQLETSAYVGKNGIDKTKEGDKRTPTGTFSLSTPFGIKADPGAGMGNYLKVTKYHYWSGQNGTYYNRLVDTREVTSYTPTKADEHLIDYKGVYNYCLLIGYNVSGEKNKGSAIFLHCKGKNSYTAGCIAVSESAMVKLVKGLKAGAQIVIY